MQGYMIGEYSIDRWRSTDHPTPKVYYTRELNIKLHLHRTKICGAVRRHSKSRLSLSRL